MLVGDVTALQAWRSTAPLVEERRRLGSGCIVPPRLDCPLVALHPIILQRLLGHDVVEAAVEPGISIMPPNPLNGTYANVSNSLSTNCRNATCPGLSCIPAHSAGHVILALAFWALHMVCRAPIDPAKLSDNL